MRGGKIRKCLQTGLPKSGAPFFSSPKVNTVKKLLPSVLSAAVLGLGYIIGLKYAMIITAGSCLVWFVIVTVVG